MVLVYRLLWKTLLEQRFRYHFNLVLVHVKRSQKNKVNFLEKGKMINRKYKILLVDDDPLVLESLAKALREKDYEVHLAENGQKAIKMIDDKNFDLVITDIVMEGLDGYQVLKAAKKKDLIIKVIMITAYGSITNTIDALRLHADDFILKPFEPHELFFRMDRCFNHLELERRIKLFEKIIPVCSACKKVRDDTGKEHGTGNWMTLEEYVQDKAKIDFSHSFCPECAKRVEREIL